MLAFHFLLAFCELHLIGFGFSNLKKKRKVKVLNTVFFLAILALELLTYQQGVTIEFSLGMVIYASLAIFSMLYALSDLKKIWLVVFFHLFASLVVTVATGLLFSFFSLEIQNITENQFYSLLGRASGVLLLLLSYVASKKIGLKINIHTLSGRSKIAIVFFTLIFGFYVTAFSQMTSTGWSQLVTSLAMIGGIIALYGIVAYIAKDTHINVIERRIARREASLIQQKEYYEFLQTKEKKMARFIHDVDKLILPLINEIDAQRLTGDLAALVNDLKKTMIDLKKPIRFKTGSDFIDANLQYLLHKHKEKEIELEVSGVLPDNHNFAIIDLISMLSNLLENAFEAVSKVEGERRITFEVRAHKTGLVIRLKNKYRGELLENKGAYATTKSNKALHGIGLRSVQAVVEKYDGNMVIETSDQVFSVEMSFPRTIYK